MAPPTLTRIPWDELHHDLVAKVGDLLPCPEDRRRASQVCRGWRKGFAPYRPLPWLLLPSAGGPTFHHLAGGCRSHHLAVPESARFFGSIPGGRLLLATDEWHGHTLLKVRTQECIAVPDLVTFVPQVDSPVVMLAATFAPAPLNIAAAIIAVRGLLVEGGPSHVTFWRQGDQVAKASVFRPDARDVVYHQDAFYVLRKDKNIELCTPRVDDDGVLNITTQTLDFKFEEEKKEMHEVVMDLAEDNSKENIELCNDVGPTTGCILVSRGELLLVERNVVTSDFTLFMMVRTQGSEAQYTWVRLPSLGGRMFFLGRGSSTSYEVDQYPDFKEAIYFLDDVNSLRNADDLGMIEVHVGLAYQNANRRRYPSTRNGMFTLYRPCYTVLSATWRLHLLISSLAASLVISVSMVIFIYHVSRYA